MRQFIHVGRQIYNKGGFNEFRRMIAFVLRSLLHNKQMQHLLAFFSSNPLRRDITKVFPAMLSQATRPFFFRNSTFAERAILIQHHFQFFEKYLSEEALRQIYVKEGLTIWSMDLEEQKIIVDLHFRDVSKKEGLMTVILRVDQEIVYQLVFWVAPDQQGQYVLWIGALQGLVGGSQVIKSLTKKFYGYRPKNIMVHVVRIIARQLSISRICAVSNFGFYDSTLPPKKQKLKTSLDSFWPETGGTLCDDPRFYEIPLSEHRKTIEEVVSHKRNLYRKRFALLDAMDVEIADSIAPHLLNKTR